MAKNYPKEAFAMAENRSYDNSMMKSIGVYDEIRNPEYLVNKKVEKEGSNKIYCLVAILAVVAMVALLLAAIGGGVYLALELNKLKSRLCWNLLRNPALLTSKS